jgi:ubiquinone/menaquinone biosynthesis C-methylase UbiE
MKTLHAVDLYDYIYSWKMYQEEAENVKQICSQILGRPIDSLLEWACGTGRYLEFFDGIDCIGVDLCEASLGYAKRRAPHAQLFCQDMSRFVPDEGVDVILALFGAIGYLDPEKELIVALENAHGSLNDGGVLLIEPWVSKRDYLKGESFLQIYRSLNLQIARLVISDQVDMQSVLKFEYLCALAGGAVQRISSEENLWLCDTHLLNEKISKAGFTVVDKKEGFMPEGELWICWK